MKVLEVLVSRSDVGFNLVIDLQDDEGRDSQFEKSFDCDLGSVDRFFEVMLSASPNEDKVEELKSLYRQVIPSAVMMSMRGMIQDIVDDELDGDDDDDEVVGSVEMPDGSPVPTWPQIFASHIEGMDEEERAEMKKAWRGLGEKLFVVT